MDNPPEPTKEPKLNHDFLAPYVACEKYPDIERWLVT
jgi:hypothetical protein